MTEAELSVILEYCEAATEGPWERCGSGVISGRVNWGLWDIAWQGASTSGNTLQLIQDGDFIARSRTDLPAVVKELRRARKLLRGIAVDRRADLLPEARDFLGGSDAEA